MLESQAAVVGENTVGCYDFAQAVAEGCCHPWLRHEV